MVDSVREQSKDRVNFLSSDLAWRNLITTIACSQAILRPVSIFLPPRGLAISLYSNYSPHENKKETEMVLLTNTVQQGNSKCKKTSQLFSRVP